MSGNIYIYILVMAGVTYLIRMLPLTLITKKIQSTFIKSFLYYVPYVTLSVMTFPAILRETSTPWSGLAGFVTALLLSYKGYTMQSSYPEDADVSEYFVVEGLIGNDGRHNQIAFQIT